MKDPLSRIPDRVASFVDLAVASNRIATFLDSEQVRGAAGPVADVAHAIELRGRFGWSSVQPRTTAQPAQKRRSGQYSALSTSDRTEQEELIEASSRPALPPLLTVEPSQSIAHGQLVYVIGTVGSGKSNLLAAMLAEMSPAGPGCVTATASDVAYLGQAAWILNMSLRKNITICGRQDPVDERRYAEALRVAGLVDDLAALAGGDGTEIGERGINISGGQKQRVCLARMVYSERPICLLDDPTSALDAVMAKHVLDEAVHGTLARQGRTRVVVTNQLSALEHADHILWMDEGRVRFSGSYNDLMATVAVGETVILMASPLHPC